MHAFIVTCKPEKVDGVVYFNQRHVDVDANGDDDIHGPIFLADLSDFDKQTILFFDHCRHTVQIVTSMVALLLQDSPVSLSVSHLAGVIAKEPICVYDETNGTRKGLSSLHTMIKVKPHYSIVHQTPNNIRGGVYLDPSRPQYREEQGAVQCSRYPVDTRMPGSYESDFYSEYKVIRDGRYLPQSSPGTPSPLACRRIETTARTVANVMWIFMEEHGGPRRLRAMSREQRFDALDTLRERWKQAFRQLKVRYNDLYNSSNYVSGNAMSRRSKEIMEETMGHGHIAAMNALGKVLGCKVSPE